MADYKDDREDEDEDEAPAAEHPLEPWKLLMGSMGVSLAVMFIGYKINKDILYDAYFYLLAVVVVALVAQHLGWIDLSGKVPGWPRARPDEETPAA